MSTVYSSGAWTAKDGEDERFVEAWTEFARWAGSMPGAGTLRLTRDLSEPGRYLSVAPGDDAGSMDAWKSAPEFRDRMGAVQQHVAEFTPSEMELVAEV